MSGAWDAENIPSGVVYVEPPFVPTNREPVRHMRVVDCLCGGRFRVDVRAPHALYSAHRRSAAHRRLTEEYQSWLG